MAPPSSRSVIRAAVATIPVAAAVSAIAGVVMVTVGDDPVLRVHAGGHRRVLVADVIVVAHSEFLALVARQSD